MPQETNCDCSIRGTNGLPPANRVINQDDGAATIGHKNIVSGVNPNARRLRPVPMVIIFFTLASTNRNS